MNSIDPPKFTYFRLTVKTKIHTTESLDRLEAAIRNVVKHVTTNVEKQGSLVGTSERIDSISIIYEQVRARQSISVLRRMLMNNLRGRTTSFLLNKQAAAAGKVALIDNEGESPLGGIRISIQCDVIQQVIDWLACAVRK
jgi:predicted RNA binding protein with dsRBD fold (UPF0201 family)